MINKIEGIERRNRLLQDENDKQVDNLSEQKMKIDALVRANKSMEEDLEIYVADAEAFQRRDKYTIPDAFEGKS